jgi:MFS transporter, FLVCR family, MFS-domain-containing protein 7
LPTENQPKTDVEQEMINSARKEDIKAEGDRTTDSRNVVVNAGPPYTRRSNSGEGEVELAERSSQGNVQKIAGEDGDTATRNSGRDGGDSTEIGADAPVTEYKVYKRRWFGLVQLTLLNVIVSWDVSATDDFGRMKANLGEVELCLCTIALICDC